MERSDFSSHRILVLGGKTHTLSLLRSILSIAGVTQIIHVEESRRALELLSMEHFTAVFCDHTAQELDGMSFPVAARRRAGMLNPMIPIFAVQERARRRDVEKARDVGVTDVLTTPIEGLRVVGFSPVVERARVRDVDTYTDCECAYSCTHTCTGS